MSLIAFIESFAHFFASRIFSEDMCWSRDAVLSGAASKQEYARFVAALLITAHSVTFFAWNLFFTAVHAVVPRKTLARWRFQDDKLAPRELIQHAVMYTATFHFVLSLLCGVYFAPWLVEKGIVSSSLGPTTTTNLVDSTPSLPIFLLNLAVNGMLGSTCFFFAHYTLHAIPLLYKHVHKQHHLFTVTCAWACEYAHPLELLIGNISPVLCGPLLLRQHPAVWFVWICLAVTQSCFGHSGLWAPSLRPRYHDWHHEMNCGNFDTPSGFWDRLFGTNGPFRRMLAEEIKWRETVARVTDWQSEVVSAKGSRVSLSPHSQSRVR